MKSAKDPRGFLWANLCSLMQQEDPSIDAAQKRTKVGRGTIQRIKEGDAQIRMNSLVSLANAFSLQPWQLLVPNLQAHAEPRLAGPLTPLVGGGVRAQQPPAPHYALDDETLLAELQRMLQRVPSSMRQAFADVLSGWAREGANDDRREALLALLRASGKAPEARTA